MERKGFLSGLSVENAVRPMILDSWTRCVQGGLPTEPQSLTLRRVSDDELSQRLEHNRELVEITRPYLRLISTVLEPITHTAYLVDRQGIVLESSGNVPDLSRNVELLPGYDWSERAMGTNGAGTALATRQAVAVIGAEHFMRHLHDCVSTAAPVHDAAGVIIGALAVAGSTTDAAPDRLKLIAQLASMIGQGLSSGPEATNASGAYKTVARDWKHT